MLKLTYTDTGMHLEYLKQSLEGVVSQRVMLALRCRQTLLLEPGGAAFLLPASLPELERLMAGMERVPQQLSLCWSDREFIEVSLSGIWLSALQQGEEGLFLVELPLPEEQLLLQLWQAAHHDKKEHRSQCSLP
jgi:hypothetical protein